jgi:hypothetical protein
MQKRQATIENHSRYRAASLDQVTARFADIRAKQEAKLQAFSQTSDCQNYENAAKYLLENEQVKGFKSLKSAKPKAIEISPSVIEIGPDSSKPEAANNADQVATR